MRAWLRVVYWIAVVTVSAILAYFLIRLAEGLDASEVAAVLIGADRSAAQRRDRDGSLRSDAM